MNVFSHCGDRGIFFYATFTKDSRMESWIFVSVCIFNRMWVILNLILEKCFFELKMVPTITKVWPETNAHEEKKISKKVWKELLQQWNTTENMLI